MSESKSTVALQAPVPYFGGKAAIAAVVWQALGQVENFVEPFFGSGAVLLGRPQPVTGTETINDADGFVSNFWRAIKDDPEHVADYADWPVNENCLHARHAWLVERKESLQARLEGDPDFYDAKIAGWWAWGMCCWIGVGFCSGKGPWQAVKKDGVLQLVHLGNAGRGVHRNLVHLGNAGRGVHRQLIRLEDAGRSVHRQRVHLGGAGCGVHRQRINLMNWFEALADRLRFVRVCCGDWARICGPVSTVYRGLTGVFLDPPYSDCGREKEIYCKESLTVSLDVSRWCLEYGSEPRLRIVLAGYEGEHPELKKAGWKIFSWHTQGGYGNQANGQGRQNARRERLWLSPHCVASKQPTLFDDDD